MSFLNKPLHYVARRLESLFGFLSVEAAGLKISTGDSGGTAAAAQDDLVIEGSGNSGMTVLAPDASFATVGLGSPSKAYGAGMYWRYSDNAMSVGTANAGAVMFLQGGDLSNVARVGAAFGVVDGITAPATVSGWSQIYVDTADGVTKVKHGDGAVVALEGGGGASAARIFLAQTTNQNVGGANGTEVYWNWQTQTRVDAGFTHSTGTNPSRIQVDADGWYRIRFIGNAQQTGANRTTLQGIYRINGGTTQRDGTIRSYSRGAGYGNITAGLEHNIQLSDGDYIEVGTRVEDTDAVYTINSIGAEVPAGESQFTVERLP